MFIRSVKLGIESYLPLFALSRDSYLRFQASAGYSYTLEADTFNLSTSRVTLGLDPLTHGFYKLLIVFHAGHIISLRTYTGDALAGVCRVLGLPNAKVKWLKVRKCLRVA
jgi:hypothetical protein